MVGHRTIVATLALVIVGDAAGCCKESSSEPAPFVAVREKALTLTLALPLTPETWPEVEKFVAAGCKRAHVGHNVVAPDAARRIAGLKPLLVQPAGISAKALKDGAVTKWFGGNAIRQVVNAGDERRSVPSPVAYFDGADCWWIFYPGVPGRARLILTKAMAKRREK